MRVLIFLLLLLCAGLTVPGSAGSEVEDAPEVEPRQESRESRRLEVKWTVEAREVEEGDVAPRVAPVSLTGKRLVFDFAGAEERLKPHHAPEDGWSAWAAVQGASRKDVFAFDGGDELDVWRRSNDGARIMEWHLSYGPHDDGKTGGVSWSIEDDQSGGAVEERYLVFETADSGYVMPYPDFFAWDFSREIRGVRFTVLEPDVLVDRIRVSSGKEDVALYMGVVSGDDSYAFLLAPWFEKDGVDAVDVSPDDTAVLRRLLRGVKAGDCKSFESADVPLWVFRFSDGTRFSSIEWALGMVAFSSPRDAEEFVRVVRRLLEASARLNGAGKSE